MLDLEGWNSWVHRESPINSASEILSLRILSLRTYQGQGNHVGRNHVGRFSDLFTCLHSVRLCSSARSPVLVLALVLRALSCECQCSQCGVSAVVSGSLVSGRPLTNNEKARAFHLLWPTFKGSSGEEASRDRSKKSAQVLVLAPTRELAVQISDEVLANHLTGFQTGSGRAGFSQKGRESPAFCQICCSMCAHVATCRHMFPKFAHTSP